MSRPLLPALAALVMVVMGCRGGPEVRNERGAGHERVGGPPDQLSATSEEQNVRQADDQPNGAGAANAMPTEEVVREEEPELDLAIRVKNAYGYPAECLGPDSVNEGITAFAIRLTVTMTETGTVTRSSVTAPVNYASLECLRRRAESLRVAGPIPDAPKTVSTSIDVRAVNRLAAAQSAEPAEPEPYVPPTGFNPADEALPAVVGNGPAAGSARADETLPAVVGNGPAAGSVSADLTLPSRGAPTERGQGWTWISGSAEAAGEVADRPEED